MENFLLEIKKFILSKIFKRHYYRTGKCKACGKCCTKIYVKHFKHVIQDEKEFKKLQFLHRFYTYLKVIDKDETGLVFECTNLDPETHKCKIHKSRPGICRRYPQEELFSMGGALSEDCGYKMLPITTFAKVMKKLAKKKQLSLILLILSALIPAYAYNGFSDRFIERFQTCSIYAEENSLNNKGTVFNDTKFFAKENASSCFYHQIIWSIYGTISLQCKFNMEQVKQLYTTMKEHNPPNGYSKKAEDLWNTFVNNKNVCSMDIKTFMDGKPLVPEDYLPWQIEKKQIQLKSQPQSAPPNENIEMTY